MRVHLEFDPLTLRSIATGEVRNSRKSALFTDVLHGLGRRTRALERIHPNGAIRLSAVWIAVKNLDASIETYKRLGLVPGRAIEAPDLAANGREIAAGTGPLLPLAPKAAHNSGPIDDFLASRGEGLMGVTIDVADIARVRDYLKAHTAGVLDPPWESADYVLIPGAAAHGLWLRLNEVSSVH
jgi:catechol 2,3-dioxygenase-like lactoylglutathione lyase family enzyme